MKSLTDTRAEIEALLKLSAALTERATQLRLDAAELSRRLAELEKKPVPDITITIPDTIKPDRP